MSTVITWQLFEDFLKCPTKCFLQVHEDAASSDAYADWLRNRNASYYHDCLKDLKVRLSPHELVEGPSDLWNARANNWRFAINLPIRIRNLQSDIQALERSHHARNAVTEFIPIRHVVSNKLTADDKLIVAFDAFVLSERLGKIPSRGRLVHGNARSSFNFALPKLISRVPSVITLIETILSRSVPPDVVLISHCSECRFQQRCRQEAIAKDDLSLLPTMAPKERKRFHKNGIFTINQLSYTFRPRRRSKRFAPKREKYHHALKALAIRQGKIHVVGRPELLLEGTPTFLDVEALPDRDFYYLIGVRFITADGPAQRSFWADDSKDEKKIWMAFLRLMGSIDHPVLVHYGSYEATFLKRMCVRYGAPVGERTLVGQALSASVNLLSTIFAQIYFPVHSNGLKDVAEHLGFTWSDTRISGIHSIVLRSTWEITKNDDIKRQLLIYNADDCAALERVTECVKSLSSSATHLGSTSIGDVVHAESLPRSAIRRFGAPQFQLSALEEVNRAAYWDYQRARVLARSNLGFRRPAHVRLPHKAKRPRANRVIEWSRPRRCPKCANRTVYKHNTFSRYLYDLRFSPGSVKRWVTKYRARRYRCFECRAVFHDSRREWRRGKWGGDLKAFLVYLTIELRISQSAAARFLSQVFGLNIGRNAVNRLKEAVATHYQLAYQRMLQRISRSTVVHADETQVGIRGCLGYVWVFTSLEEAVYIHASSRDGELVRSLLRNFRGVLVSDFYSAYESVDCVHQKCLIHLIRDINDDLMREPFNEEMKALAGEFASLLKPIIETVDRFGLKARYLRRHKLRVRGFFKWLSRNDCKSDLALKCKKRLEKWRDSLFTFLDHDGVPWNNNNAEHAIKAFAMLRRVMGGAPTEKGLREYLILLSIYETCAFKNVSFLEFLRSGEPEIDAFVNLRGH